MAAALGAALRIGYVLGVTRHENSKFYDAFVYLADAGDMAGGHFFRVVFGHGPDAAYPPLTSMVLAPTTYVFGLHPGATAQRITMALLGVTTVVCTGLLGRAVGGARVGIAAGALAALYPNLWVANGIVMSETLSALGAALILLSVYRLLRRPTPANAALAGLACGTEVLVRAELVLFVPALLVPAALVAGAPKRRRLGLAALGCLAAAAVVMPWVGRNLATFHDTTLLSTGGGTVLLGANCPATYYGAGIGSWSLDCVTAVKASGDQSQVNARYQAVAVHYVEGHASRVPLVVAARVGRLWGVFQPVSSAEDVNEGRPDDVALAGMAGYYLLLPAAALGALRLRRRGGVWWPLMVPAGVVSVAAALSFGLMRLRTPFEVCLVVLAACVVRPVSADGHRRRRIAGAGSFPQQPGGSTRPGSELKPEVGRRAAGGEANALAGIPGPRHGGVGLVGGLHVGGRARHRSAGLARSPRPPRDPRAAVGPPLLTVAP